MKKNIAIICALALALSGCANVKQKVENAFGKVAAVAQAVQPALVPACNAAMTLAGVAGPVAPWIIAGCSTAEVIDKIALDPSSTEWVNKLIVQAENVVAAARS